jgi:hypothetical protein
MLSSLKSQENEREASSQDHWDLVDAVTYAHILLNNFIFGGTVVQFCSTVVGQFPMPCSTTLATQAALVQQIYLYLYTTILM